MISVDTKKKELVGADPGYKNNGRDYQPKGRPIRVGVHDVPDPQMPKAVPYGIYDLAANTGWVSVGCDGDTVAGGRGAAVRAPLRQAGALSRRDMRARTRMAGVGTISALLTASAALTERGSPVLDRSPPAKPRGAGLTSPWMHRQPDKVVRAGPTSAWVQPPCRRHADAMQPPCSSVSTG